jgi:plastocyanin
MPTVATTLACASLFGFVLAGGAACQKGDRGGETGTTQGAASAGSSTASSTAALGSALAAGPGKLGTGRIKGTVHYSGKPDEPRPVTTPDPFCSQQKLGNEDLLVSPAGGLANVLVHVSQGASGTYPPPATEAIVDQSGCMYRPRVQAVLAGQTVQIRNSDQTLHNVHSYKGASTLFNQAQIPGTPPMTRTLSPGGQIIKFRCDVHPWMTGYVGVLSNPFFAVTGADGSFSIDKLPAGTYTLEAWHERTGVKSSTPIVVADGQTATASFDFGAP